jgi:S-adenosyl-L-methionine hydrolase (adenosine-forming)
MILFLSDYGLDEEYVGVCHAVMARIAPDVRVVDITHGIPPMDVAAGAVTLASAIPYAPPDAVLLAVVDPGVGTKRRPVVVEAGRALLVGPDNGLLAPAWRELGGAGRAFVIASRTVIEEPVSDTFHGRDVFAPAAAHLASGLDPAEVGPAVGPSTLRHLSFAVAEVEGTVLRTWVAAVDRFGNVRLRARPTDLVEAGLHELPELGIGDVGIPVRRVRTFAEVPEGMVGLLVDSRGHLALVRGGAGATEKLGLAPGDAVTLTPPDDAVG